MIRRAAHADLLSVWILPSVLWSPQPGRSDVQPGELIDAANWEKAEGLLPGPVLEWVKRGEFILRVGKLTLNPRDLHPQFVLEGFETNRGRYAIGPKDGIVEKATGRASTGRPSTWSTPSAGAGTERWGSSPCRART